MFCATLLIGDGPLYKVVFVLGVNDFRKIFYT